MIDHGEFCELVRRDACLRAMLDAAIRVISQNRNEAEQQRLNIFAYRARERPTSAPHVRKTRGRLAYNIWQGDGSHPSTVRIGADERHCRREGNKANATFRARRACENEY